MSKVLLINTILIFTSIQFINKLSCQSYQPLVEDEKVWSIVTFNPSLGPNCIWKTYQIKTSDDTIIGHKVMKSLEHSSFEYQSTTWTNIGYIYEDSSHKVFYLYDTLEMILYDFGANLHDTLTITCPYFDPLTFNLEFYHKLEMIVNNIDYVYLENSLRKRIKLKPICSSEIYTTWIEGIGDMQGVLKSCIQVNCIGDSIIGIWQGAPLFELLCCQLDDSLTYINQNYNTCYYYSMAGMNTKSEQSIEYLIYPHPVKNLSTLEIINSHKGRKQFEIYSLSGCKVAAMSTNDNKFFIDRKLFSRGLYTFKLILGNGQYKVGKLMIQ